MRFISATALSTSVLARAVVIANTGFGIDEATMPATASPRSARREKLLEFKLIVDITQLLFQIASAALEAEILKI